MKNIKTFEIFEATSLRPPSDPAPHKYSVTHDGGYKRGFDKDGKEIKIPVLNPNSKPKKSSYTIVDPEGNEIATFKNISDAIIYKKSVKDQTGIDYEIEY